MFLDADDLYDGAFISGLEAAALRDNADLALGSTQNVNPDGTFGDLRRPPDHNDTEAFVIAWLNHGSVQTNSYFWRTEYLRAIGGFREDMRTLEEIELVVRAAFDGARRAVSLEGCSHYRHFDRPGRVSRGASYDVISSAMTAFDELSTHPAASREVLRALGARLYFLARGRSATAIATLDGMA